MRARVSAAAATTATTATATRAFAHQITSFQRSLHTLSTRLRPSVQDRPHYVKPNLAFGVSLYDLHEYTAIYIRV